MIILLQVLFVISSVVCFVNVLTYVAALFGTKFFLHYINTHKSHDILWALSMCFQVWFWVFYGGISALV